MQPLDITNNPMAEPCPAISCTLERVSMTHPHSACKSGKDKHHCEVSISPFIFKSYSKLRVWTWFLQNICFLWVVHNSVELSQCINYFNLLSKDVVNVRMCEKSIRSNSIGCIQYVQDFAERFRMFNKYLWKITLDIH